MQIIWDRRTAIPLAGSAAKPSLIRTAPALRSIRRSRFAYYTVHIARRQLPSRTRRLGIAQAMFTGSIGNVFGGDAPSTKKTWAVAIGGGGAHGIGSELEFSQTGNFFETPAVWRTERSSH